MWVCHAYYSLNIPKNSNYNVSRDVFTSLISTIFIISLLQACKPGLSLLSKLVFLMWLIKSEFACMWDYFWRLLQNVMVGCLVILHHWYWENDVGAFQPVCFSYSYYCEQHKRVTDLFGQRKILIGKIWKLFIVQRLPHYHFPRKRDSNTPTGTGEDGALLLCWEYFNALSWQRAFSSCERDLPPPAPGETSEMQLLHAESQ